MHQIRNFPDIGRKYENIKTCQASRSKSHIKKTHVTPQRHAKKIGDSVFLKRNQSSMFEPKLASMKSELQKLSYRDKIILIDHIVRKSRELCHEYGYFYVTATML